MNFLGPVQRLRLWSTVLPNFVSEEEQAMRNADMVLQSVPIIWYRRMKVQSNRERKSGYLMDAVKDVTACGNKPVVLNRSSSNSTETSRFSPYFEVDSTFNVIDTAEGPALEIVSNQFNFEDSDSANNGLLSTMTGNKQTVMRKVFLFKEMEIATPGEESDWKSIGITPNENTFVILVREKKEGTVETKKINASESNADDSNSLAASATNTTFSQQSSAGTRLVACQLLPDSKLSLSRDEALRHLNALISWDKMDPSIANYSSRLLCGTSIGNTFTNCGTEKNEQNAVVPQLSTTIKLPPSSFTSGSSHVEEISGGFEVQVSSEYDTPNNSFTISDNTEVEPKPSTPDKRKDDEIHIDSPPSLKSNLPPSPPSVMSGFPYDGFEPFLNDNKDNAKNDINKKKLSTTTSLATDAHDLDTVLW